MVLESLFRKDYFQAETVSFVTGKENENLPENYEKFPAHLKFKYNEPMAA